MAERALILGGTGILGPPLCKALLDRRFDVFVFNRGTNPERMVPGARHIPGDRRSISDINMLKNYTFDVVIDTMGWYSRAMPILIDILSPRIRKFIFISSVAVYGPRRAAWSEEEPLPAPNPVWTKISREKQDCEVVCRQAEAEGFPAVILRLSHLWGFGGSMSREQALLRRLRTGQAIGIPGSGEAKLQFIHIIDVVAVCVDIVSHRHDTRWRFDCYNLTSDRIYTIREWVIQCARWTGMKANLVCRPDQKSRKGFIYLPGDVAARTERIQTATGRHLRDPDGSVVITGFYE